MVPFYGQGMNAGLEDVRILFEFLDLQNSISTPSTSPEFSRAAGLKEYSDYRQSDAYAINDLALMNYKEMRASVTSVSYKLRKYLEENISVLVPGLGWKTQYSRVSFGTERYSEVVKRSERQGMLLLFWGVGVIGTGFIGTLVGLGMWGTRWWVGRRR